VALLLVLALVEPSLAATSRVGRNVGNEVESWAKGLLLGVAALVGIPVLFRRDFGGGLVLALLVVVVGAFVFAPSAVKAVISSLWRAIAG
jgi:hypothetical protein